MKYTKIHPLDFYLLLKDVDLLRLPVASSNSVKISVSGPGVPTPYSFKQPLIQFNGITYLRTTTVRPSKEALAQFDAELLDRIREENSAAGEVICTYDPESE